MNNRFTVFYAWQSVNPTENRSFIEDCLESALKQLALPRQIAYLDRDTKGVAGTPDIIATILDKIKGSNAFVADVSLVGSDLRSERTPNPNVMFELGYAVATLGWESVILVVNEALGRWENGPFDLGGTRRRPIRYTLAPTDNKPEIKRQLREDLVRALREVCRSNVPGDVLRCGDTAHLNVSGFLGMSVGQGPSRISTFQAKLTNVSDRPIQNIAGAIQVDRSNARFPMMLNRDGNIVHAASMNHLPLHESVGIVVPFVTEPASFVEETTFIEEFTPFTLVISIDGADFTFRFSRSQAQDCLTKFRGPQTPPPGPIWRQ